jgi:hypothetical protein
MLCEPDSLEEAFGCYATRYIMSGSSEKESGSLSDGLSRRAEQIRCDPTNPKHPHSLLLSGLPERPLIGVLK